MAALGQAGVPRRGGVRLDLDALGTVAGPRVEPAVLATRTPVAEHPAAGPHGAPRRLVVAQQAGEELHQDLGLRVAAHRAENGPERSVGPRDQRRGQGVRGPAAGGPGRRVAVAEGEADAAVVEEDAGGRLDDVGAPPRGVRLDERDAHAVAVDHAPDGGPAGPHGGGHGDAVGGVDAGPLLVEAVRVQQLCRVGGVVQHGVPVAAGHAGGLDEQVGPRRVVGVVGQGQPAGHRCAGQRQVALRRRGCRVHGVAPGVDRHRVDPLGLGAGEVVAGEEALAEPQQPVAEGAEVERRPAVGGDALEGRGHAGAAEQRARGQPPAGGHGGLEVVVDAVELEHQRGHERQQR